MKLQLNAETLNKVLEAGGNVEVGTHAHITRYSKRHAGMFTQGADGIYVAHGRGKNFLGDPNSSCGMLVSVRAFGKAPKR